AELHDDVVDHVRETGVGEQRGDRVVVFLQAVYPGFADADEAMPLEGGEHRVGERERSTAVRVHGAGRSLQRNRRGPDGRGRGQDEPAPGQARPGHVWHALSPSLNSLAVARDQGVGLVVSAWYLARPRHTRAARIVIGVVASRAAEERYAPDPRGAA